MGREFELKFRATPAQQEALVGYLGAFSPTAMETVYYDTPEKQLSARHLTLRRRLENGKAICTLKTPDLGGARGEWETEQENILQAIPVLCKLSGFSELASLAQNGLAPICGARFTRLAKTLDFPPFSAEIALDRGCLLGGERELPFCEVEVEFKSGSQAAMTLWAQKLATKFGLIPEQKSKFRRALDLATGE